MIFRLAALPAIAALCLSAQPPKLRVDDSIRPVKYAADLTLLTGAATFTGTVDIDIQLQKPAVDHLAECHGYHHPGGHRPGRRRYTDRQAGAR